METHVRDLFNVLTCEDLHDVILLGKSYSGIVITGVAERAPERLRHLVYLDALVPRDGQSFLDMAGLAATTAHRGCRHVRIPTTTLSQDDSGVGVKPRALSQYRPNGVTAPM